MSTFSWLASKNENVAPEVLWEDGERVCSRMHRAGSDGARHEFVAVLPAPEVPSPESINRLAHEYELKDYLDSAWAVRPLALIRERGQTLLVVEHPCGEPLSRLIVPPMEIGQFLRIAVALSVALGRLHSHGLIHKDIKPSNVLVNSATGEVWLTGFGIASRLPREHQTPVPPDSIAGTLAYMSPEQTGRMNRSIDSRSDLYSLGVTLYQMLTGELPFAAADPLEWVHCHIARQPVAPADRREIPEPLSSVTMRLLAKNAEERYQTAAGLEADLRQCLAQWQSHGRIESFPLGADDSSDRLLIPERLYGREREVHALLAAFDRAVAGGRPELVLVSGYSGIGKSAVVNELHKSLVPPRGFFASGKFDQYKRDIPYATVAQAFQSLIRPLLSKPEAELSKWRDDLLQALSPNGALVVDLVPELKLIIGEQPTVAALQLQEAKTRSYLAFRRFIGVFARPEHPLALFLDDLQWLDAATLDFLEDLLVQQDVAHLLVVGAYRDNEVDSAHPLVRKLSAIREAGGTVQEIRLAPLSSGDLAHLIADALHCESQPAASLAQLIHDKTAGNPFFAIQFIHALVEEGLITFEHGVARWRWDMDAIHAKGYTDNVVDLMVAKLNRLPVTTQRALQQFACIGNNAEAATLAAVLETSEQETETELWEALRLELIVRSENSYRFVHDRVQEAAYSLLAEEMRAEDHLRIGRLLHAHIPPEKREEAIFEIVNQFNRGAELVTSEDERFQLAELNLMAGKRAKASTAYSSALKYFIAGEALLTKAPWERNHDLIFQLELQRAGCEFLTGEAAVAAERLEMLRTRASNTVELAMATCLGIDVYMTLYQIDRAVAIGLEYLHGLGIDWPLHPTEEQVRSEYERIWSQLGSRAIEEVMDFPLMSDPTSIATLDVLTKAATPALLTDTNLFALVTCRAVSFSIERGNNDGSCFHYVWLSTIAGPRLGDYKNAIRFGQLGYELVEKRGLKRFQASTYVTFASGVMPWTKHLVDCCDVNRQAFEIANTIGDLTYAAYSRIGLNTLLIAAGEPLVDVQSEAELGLNFAQKAKFGLVSVMIRLQLGLIRTFRGLTIQFGSFDHAEFDEMEFERHLDVQPTLVHCWYWIRKLQARFFAGDFASAIEASLKARPLLLESPGFELAEYEFHSALARAACCDSATPEESREHFDALLAHHKQLQIWAEHCPENFEDRAALVGAEIGRIEGRTLDAEQLYEDAIRSAQANGFVQNEALANELAARFYRARGLEKIAKAYLMDARHLYARWGADGKVKQLDELHPRQREEQTHTSSATIGPFAGQLDVETVVKASQALSSEMVLPRLIEKLVGIAVEHAGAERGLLILIRDGEPRIEAEATTGQGRTEVVVRQAQVTSTDLPQSALHYVIRTQESVLLDDASADNGYSKDEYVRQKHSRSVLCLPIVKQKKLVGALYLENNLTPGVFTPDRVAVLQLLASQAAISLENASLYTDLQRNEAFLAQGQKMSHTGSFGRNVLSDRLYWSEETYKIYELDRSVEPTLEWMIQRIHPEDRVRVEQTIEHASHQRTGFDIEYRLLRRDNSVKYLHVVVQALENDAGELEFVGAATDITERKQAERDLSLIIDTIPTLSWCNLTDGSNEFLSKNWHEYTGLSPEEAHGWGWQAAFHPEDLPPLMKRWQEMLVSGEAGEVEARLRRHDGIYRWFLIRAEPFRNESGIIVRWYGTSTDIHDRKQAEEALRDSEQSFRLILDGIAGLVAIMSSTGEVEVVNRQALEYFGKTPDQLKGWSTGDAVHPDDLPSVYSAWVRSVETVSVYDTDHRLRRADGVYRWFHARGLPLCDSEGHALRWYVLLTDIHDRKQAEEKVRHSEELLAESQRLSLTGSFMWRVATDEIAWSKQLYRIFEFDQAVPVTFELIGARVHPEDLLTFKGQIERSRQDGSDMELELRLQMPDRSVKYLHIVAHNRGDDDRPEYIGAVRDVTQRRLSEEALTKARSELAHVVGITSMGVMTASIAHEVNQPLSGIITNASTCLRMLNVDPPNLDGARETARRTIRDGNRASDVITRLRTLYSKKEPSLEPMDLNEAAREVIALLLSELERNGVILQHEFADDLPIVAADRIQLQQVILNLVRNASDAMRDIKDRPRWLLIRTKQVNENACVTIQDSGIGFDSTSADRLFESFYTTKPEGMGIGLSVSRSIIEAHGGRLWATANDGHGATFAFSIPCQRPT